MAEQEQPEQQGSNVSEFNRYLNNNTDILREKFSQFYQAPFPLAQLTQPPHLEHSFDFIYDVFNFGKYRDNEALNLTLRTSLQVNITDFQQNQTDSSFEPEMAIRLLKYCIQHNEMFAVHYDKKQAAQQSSEARPEGNR